MEKTSETPGQPRKKEKEGGRGKNRWAAHGREHPVGEARRVEAARGGKCTQKSRQEKRHYSLAYLTSICPVIARNCRESSANDADSEH